MGTRPVDKLRGRVPATAVSAAALPRQAACTLSDKLLLPDHRKSCNTALLRCMFGPLMSTAGSRSWGLSAAGDGLSGLAAVRRMCPLPPKQAASVMPCSAGCQVGREPQSSGRSNAAAVNARQGGNSGTADADSRALGVPPVGLCCRAGCDDGCEADRPLFGSSLMAGMPEASVTRRRQTGACIAGTMQSLLKVAAHLIIPYRGLSSRECRAAPVAACACCSLAAAASPLLSAAAEVAWQCCRCPQAL